MTHTFEFQGQSIRAIVQDGELWFVARDVAVALGYNDPAAAVSKILVRNIEEFKGCQGVTKLTTPGGSQDVSILNEFGLYSFCMLARTDQAVEFRKFVRQIIVEWRKSIFEQGVTNLVAPSEHTESESANSKPIVQDIEDALILAIQQIKELRLAQEELRREFEAGRRKQLPLLPTQKGELKKAVWERFKYLTRNGYHTSYQKIYAALNGHFGVSTYSEIPGERLNDALKFVKSWRPPGTPIQEQAEMFN